jgi:hypothetical protein
MKCCLISKNGTPMIGTDIEPLPPDQAWVAQAAFMILSRSSARSSTREVVGPGFLETSLREHSGVEEAVDAGLAPTRAPIFGTIWRSILWKPFGVVKRRSRFVVLFPAPLAKAQEQQPVRRPQLAPHAVDKDRSLSVGVSFLSPKPVQSVAAQAKQFKTPVNPAEEKGALRKMRVLN